MAPSVFRSDVQLRRSFYRGFAGFSIPFFPLAPSLTISRPLQIVRPSDECVVRHATAGDVRERKREAIGVLHFALVETKRLFVQIPKQVERFD